jgi:hypothetical protein
MTSTTDRPSPIEVWLRKANIQVTCTVVREDESTQELSVDSLSMRGAEREMTGHFIRQGYTPVGRWETTAGNGVLEVMRIFKQAR